MSKNWDAIIIGAGHNALAAAVHLGTKGWKVLVLEKADVAGGAVKTTEATIPGFYHDLYAMNLSMFAGSPFYAKHKNLLDDAGLSFAGAGKTFVSVFPDNTWLGVDSDLGKTSENISRLSRADAEKWKQMVADFPLDAKYIFPVLGTPIPSFAFVKILWRMWREKGIGHCMNMAKLMVSSPRNWLNANFKNDKLKAMMAAWGMHLDFGPDVAGGALFPYLESMACQSFGMALGQGGANTIIRAMQTVIEANGGEVRVNSNVEKIITDNDRALGVLLNDGTRINAGKAVIACVHPKALYGKLLGLKDLPPPAKLRPGPATMMIHMAMDEMPKWKAGTEPGQYAYVHIAPDFEYMANVYTQAMDGLLPEKPILVVGQPTVFDKTRAPDGKHTLWVQVRALPYNVKGDSAGKVKAGEWDDIKEDYADRAMEILEQYAPGISQHVIARKVLSPLDLERDNPNLVHGDSLSGSHHIDQFFLFRPAFGYSRWKTNVRGLYNIGASTWPGAGTGAGSGFMLACTLAGE